MEGIIDMGAGDNTNPWDMARAGFKGLFGHSKKQADPDIPSLGTSPSPAAPSGNPYADPITRERAIQAAIKGKPFRPDPGEAFGSNMTEAQTGHKSPEFKTDAIRNFHELIVPYIPLIASNPYRDSPFYKDSPIVDSWYKNINARVANPRHAANAVDMTGGRRGLQGSIATEPQTQRAYAPPITKTVASIPSETEIEAGAYAPVRDTVMKLSPFGWAEDLFDSARLKQTREAIDRFMDSGTGDRTAKTNASTVKEQTQTGENHANPVARTDPDASASGTTRQKTQTAAGQDSQPLVQSETEQAYASGQDLLEGLKTVLPDAGVGAIVAGGKAAEDAARFAGFVTGTDLPKEAARKINEGMEKLIRESGSGTLNRQRDAIAQKMNDQNANAADIAQTMADNPYGSLFGVGTEMGSIALPGGGAKIAQKGLQWGMKVVPKIAEYGAKLLPYVPQAIQTLQGVGDSLAQTEGQEPGQRAAKALITGTITAAGSLASGGGVAGEIGRRLTNQVTNGTVKAATSYAWAIGKQALLSGTQGAASSVGNDFAERKVPDLNKASKLATKGAIEGFGTGIFVRPVPSERKSAKMVEAAGNGNKNAHTLPKHGKQTTREQQLLRANEGIAPDGSVDKRLNDASKWLRHVDTADGIQVAKRRREEKIRLNPHLKNKPLNIDIDFDMPVGEGYLKETNRLIKTNKAIFRFNEKGELITSYPKIRD